jgi:hypothetical protein
MQCSDEPLQRSQLDFVFKSRQKIPSNILLQNLFTAKVRNEAGAAQITHGAVLLSEGFANCA